MSDWRATGARLGDAASRLLLGGLFAYAAWDKILDPASFSEAVSAYGLLPQSLVGFFSAVLPMGELLVAVSLVTTKWARESALGIACLLGMFLVALLQAALRGLNISCGCFGPAEASAEASLGEAVVRDLLMLVPTVWLVMRPNGWLLPGRFRWLPLAVAVVTIPIGLWQGGRTTTIEQPVVAPAKGPLLEFGPEEAVDGVVAGQWTTNFPTALGLARTNHRPLVMMASSEHCDHCARMKRIFFDQPTFRAWVEGSGIYLAKASIDETNSCPVQLELVNFILASPEAAKPHGWPFLGVYWPREDGPEVRSYFTADRGHMPGALVQANTASAEFVAAMNVVLGDYFARLKNPPTWERVKEKSGKYFKLESEGTGQILSRSPQGGWIQDDGSRLQAEARGHGFKGWRWPNGRIVRSPRLNLNYYSEKGTYTALFEYAF